MKNKSRVPVEIYTDGSCNQSSGRGFNGGYGIVQVFGDRHKTIKSNTYSKTTIYKMELKAIIKALEETKPGFDIYLYSDFKNAIDFINDKLEHIMALGILNRYPEPELWRRFLDARREHIYNGSSLNFFWIRAHQGCKYNEMADKLAGQAARGKEKVKCKTDN